MKWPFVILWRLIFGPPQGNYVGCLDNDALDDELDAIAEFERKTA